MFVITVFSSGVIFLWNRISCYYVLQLNMEKITELVEDLQGSSDHLVCVCACARRCVCVCVPLSTDYEVNMQFSWKFSFPIPDFSCSAQFSSLYVLSEEYVK